LRRFAFAALMLLLGVPSSMGAKFTSDEWGMITGMRDPWVRYIWAKNCMEIGFNWNYFTSSKIDELRQELIGAISKLPQKSIAVVRDTLDGYEKGIPQPSLQQCQRLAGLINDAGGVLTEPKFVVERVDPMTVGIELHWLTLAKACRYQGFEIMSESSLEAAMDIWEEQLGLLADDERIIVSDVVKSMHDQVNYDADLGKCNGTQQMLAEYFPSAF